jgi:hypothetical protein
MVANQYISEEQRSFIDKLDPRKVIPHLGEQLLGIETKTEKDSSKVNYIVKRYSKPTFTEEFVSMLKNILYGYINDVTSFSLYDDEKITMRVKNIGLELNTFFAIQGNDHYISDDTWEKVLRINDSAEKWTKFNINWDYNKPVTSEMIQYVKNYEENVDQEVVLMQVASGVRRLIESCFRRSTTMPDSYGMMASILNQTRDETVNMQNQGQQVPYQVTQDQPRW